MSVIPINDHPKLVSGTFSQPYTVKNSGTNPVYLGQDSSLTIGTRSFSMPPGSTLAWPGTSELWAMTDPGLTSEIEFLYGSNNAFTPGPTDVNATIAGPVAVSGIGSTVSIGGTVAVNNVVSVIQNNAVDLIANVNTPTVPPYSCDVFGGNAPDLQFYNSLILFINMVSTFPTYGNANFLRIQLQWADQPGGSIILTETKYAFAQFNYVRTTFQVKARFCTITIICQDGTTGSVIRIPQDTVYVWGSRHDLAQSFLTGPDAYPINAATPIVSVNIGSSDTGFYRYRFIQPASTLRQYAIPVVQGNSDITIQFLGTVNASNSLALMLYNPFTLSPTSLFVNFNPALNSLTLFSNIQLGPMLWGIQFNNVAAASSPIDIFNSYHGALP